MVYLMLLRSRTWISGCLRYRVLEDWSKRWQAVTPLSRGIETVVYDSLICLKHERCNIESHRQALTQLFVLVEVSYP